MYPGVATPSKPSRVQMTLDPLTSGRIAPAMAAIVGADGTFAFDNVPPGVYRLLPRDAPGIPPTDIEVGSSAIRNVEVRFTASVPITFRWSMDDGSALPDGPAAVLPLTIARTGEKFAAWSSVDTRRGAPYPMIPGEYHLFIRPTNGLYLRSLHSGTADLRQRPLVVAPGSGGMTVVAVLSRMSDPDMPLARVSGRVTGNHGGVEVGLVDVTTPVSSARSPWRHTTATADGTFEFAGVPPGRYEIDVPPARAVLDGFTVAGRDVNLEVSMPQGQVVAGVVSHFAEEGGQRRRGMAGAFTLRFSSATVVRTQRITRVIFWDALPSGEYWVTVEGLAPGASVEALRAGSVNLLTHPFFVPANRPPETIMVSLRGTPY
jgi:hypothetical protein